MQWTTQLQSPTIIERHKFRRKPFLVLPLLDNVTLDSKKTKTNCTFRSSPWSRTPSPMGLKLVTNGNRSSSKMSDVNDGVLTWPPKVKKRNKNNPGEKMILERPRTATLDKPKLLDISFIEQIDMSLVRKEFLTITNLCKIPVPPNVIDNSNSTAATNIADKSSPVIRHAQSKYKVRNSTVKKRSKRNVTSSERSSEDDSSSVIIAKPKRNTTKVKICSLIDNKRKIISPLQKSDSNNNSADENLKTPRGKKSVNKERVLNDLNRKDVDVFLSAGSSETKIAFPEPCRTCGRPDQPERFHSHPATPLKASDKQPFSNSFSTNSSRNSVIGKTTVQKPVPIKYRSRRANVNGNNTNTLRVVSEGKNSVPSTPSLNPMETQERPKSASRRLRTCYLCGREFGTASLPLHEPKCLEKWERENAQLPPNQRRVPPPKPDRNLTSQEWNEFAWKTSQSTLIACEHCGRTFLPDRLGVHQRSCRPGVQRANFLSKLDATSPTPSGGGASSPSPSGGTVGPPTVPCYICDRKFGSKSIVIHEPQCLKKWHAQNDLLPPSQRELPPNKNAMPAVLDDSSGMSTPLVTSSVSKSADASASGSVSDPPPKRTLPCYLCGREFTPRSLKIHEPQCLKKWRIENDKLPPSQRRKEPLKPDIIFTAAGKIDFGATNDVYWETHLNQLIPCNKCGRTFNSDRVNVHERSCKGP